jgi:hypothetical protein
MTQNIIGIVQEGDLMVHKKMNCKWSWWHKEPNIKIRYKLLGGAWVSIKPSQNNIKTTTI